MDAKKLHRSISAVFGPESVVFLRQGAALHIMRIRIPYGGAS
ncbi:hypothetical protein SC1_00512 [Sphingopyxis sp. C-1]|nr:hypothetical protein SC1_00512 [Sphingopyxis sp. C-1]